MAANRKTHENQITYIQISKEQRVQMNFFFYFINNTAIPLCIDPKTQSQTLLLNFALVSQPLALNLEGHNRVALLHNFNENATNTPYSPSDSKFKKQKAPKKREKNFLREQVSAKKNGQSNIINSYFSYILSRIHSEGFVKRVVRSLKKSQIESQKIISIFYIIMRLVNLRRARRYINKVILWDFFTVEKLEQMFENLQTSLNLTYEEISSLLRKCFLFYLRQISLTSILTSKRIPSHSKYIHLEKRRRMREYVCFQEDIRE